MNKKLTRARTQLILDQPFFGSLALRLRLVEDPTVDTAYTDGVVLGYNRRFIQGLSLEQTKWVLAHEVMHLACMHHTRRAARDRPGKMLGEVRDAPSKSFNQVEASWKVALAQAAQQAKAMGTMSAGVQRLVNQELYPDLDWRVLLRHFLEQSASNDYSWMAPCRRYLCQGLCLPGLHSKEPGHVVVAVDTSASIDSKALNHFAAEISGILDNYDTTIDVVYCDRAVRGHERFERQDLPLKLTPVGGGGTDFRPVFYWLKKQQIEPCCLVYLTDLECNRFPEDLPQYAVLWVKTGTYENQPPFGDVVKLN